MESTLGKMEGYIQVIGDKGNNMDKLDMCKKMEQ